MNLFLLNLLLAIVWMLMWGSVDIFTLLAGFVIGYVLLGLFSRALQVHGYASRVWQLLAFALYFMRVMVVANWWVAKMVVQPRYRQIAAIVRFPIEGMTDVQITTFANAITLTPGTLSMDLSEDKRFLYVHCMAGQDRPAVMASLEELHRRLMRGVFE